MMRNMVLGCVFLAGMLVADLGVSLTRAARAEDGNRPQSAQHQLIALNYDRGESGQQIVLVDPTRRTMSVYHVDPASGAVKLKSVRNVHWDLLMEEFNTANPLPRELQAIVNSK